MSKHSITAWAFVVSLVLAASASAGAPEIGTYRTGIDLGNTPSTGCDFDLGGVSPGSVPGFELEATVQVDSSQIPPQVLSAELATCDGSGFATPVALSGVDLELNTGFLDADSIIIAIPASVLAGTTSIRLAHYARSADGSEDILVSSDGTSRGGAITVALTLASPAPTLSAMAIFTALVALTVVACRQIRRRTWASGSIIVLAVFTVAAAVVQAEFSNQVASDPTSDASQDQPRAEIFASFAMTSGSGVLLRLDIEDLETPPAPTPTPTSTATASASSSPELPTATATASASSSPEPPTATATASASPDGPTATATATATASASATPRTPVLTCQTVRDCRCDDLDPCTIPRCLRNDDTGLCMCVFVPIPDCGG